MTAAENPAKTGPSLLFVSIYHYCVWGWCVGVRVPQQLREHLCGVGSLLAVLQGAWGANAGHRAWTPCAFYQWAISWTLQLIVGWEESCWSGQAGRLGSSRNPPVVLLQQWGYKCTTMPSFHVDAADPSPVLVIVRQALYTLSHPLPPLLCFKGIINEKWQSTCT